MHEHLSARTLVSQHGVPKSGLWKGFSWAPTAAFAAVGYLVSTPVTYPDVDGHEEGFRVKMVEGVLPVWKHSTPLFAHPRDWVK